MIRTVPSGAVGPFDFGLALELGVGLALDAGVGVGVDSSDCDAVPLGAVAPLPTHRVLLAQPDATSATPRDKAAIRLIPAVTELPTWPS